MVVLRVDQAASRQVICETPKRPRDPAQLADLMIDIASSEVEDLETLPPSYTDCHFTSPSVDHGRCNVGTISRTISHVLALA